MDFPIIKINHDKKIGSVIFIVEGGRNEFSLSKQIFTKVLNFHYIERRRTEDQFYEKRDEYNRIQSKIAVVNTETSNIKSIEDKNDFLDEIMKVLSLQYDFDIDNSAIFYIFDRDPQSNKNAAQIRRYIETLTDPYENTDFERGGLILLSYPSIEVYLVSNFKDDVYQTTMKIGNKLKIIIGNAQGEIEINKITESTICHALSEMLKYFYKQQVSVQLDDFSKTNLSIFMKQEQHLQINETYQCLSLISIAFLYLGILEITEG